MSVEKSYIGTVPHPFTTDAQFRDLTDLENVAKLIKDKIVSDIKKNNPFPISEVDCSKITFVITTSGINYNYSPVE